MLPSLTRRGLFAACALGLSLSARAELPNYDLWLEDGRLSPRPLIVTAGERFKLTLHNVGTGPAEFESDDLRLEKVLAPGVHSFVVVYPLRPGEYVVYDEFHRPASNSLLIAE